MDHRISKDMISNGMTPSGQRSQQDLSRTQYGSAATPASLAEAYKKIHEMKGPALPGEPGRPGTPKAPGGRPHLPGEKQTPKPKGTPGLRLAGADLFDIVKGHLMSEGLSEEDALKKMLEMTEVEKAEIVEMNAGPRGYKRPGTYDPNKFYWLGPGSLPSPNIPYTGPGYSKKSKQKDSVVAHHELKGDVISEGQV